MEPLLHKDAIFEVPTMQNCNDIHEYSKQLNSYFEFEEMNKCYFTPCEKSTMVLNNLDS